MFNIFASKLKLGLVARVQLRAPRTKCGVRAQNIGLRGQRSVYVRVRVEHMGQLRCQGLIYDGMQLGLVVRVQFSGQGWHQGFVQGLGFNICCGMLLVGSFRNGRYVKGRIGGQGLFQCQGLSLWFGLGFRVYFSGYG